MPGTIRDAPVELKWIEEKPQSPLGPPPEADFGLIDSRTFKEHVWNKSKENIFVPLGLIATTACLTMGLFNFRQGNREKQQLYMRGRIGFQAFTFVAMSIGMYLTATRKNTPVK